MTRRSVAIASQARRTPRFGLRTEYEEPPRNKNARRMPGAAPPKRAIHLVSGLQLDGVRHWSAGKPRRVGWWRAV